MHFITMLNLYSYAEEYKVIFSYNKGSLLSLILSNRIDVNRSLFSSASPYLSDSENLFSFRHSLIVCVFFEKMFIQIQGSFLNKICFVLKSEFLIYFGY